MGLSPRLRGNHRQHRLHHLDQGSIPAPAGEPAQSRRLAALGTVYPRACGGTVHRQRRRLTDHGLSPRLRGNQGRASLDLMRTRSIPAPAGEPLRAEDRDDSTKVYPRACGGTQITTAPGFSPNGLSPRLRGNHDCNGDRQKLPRSIPAPAGEPLRAEDRDDSTKVYPRACGGTRVGHVLEVADPGLSPRLRGNQLLPVRYGVGQRSIPAPAGEPIHPRAYTRQPSVYPRACGGTVIDWGIRASIPGLSPRLRGNQRQPV